MAKIWELLFDYYCNYYCDDYFCGERQSEWFSHPDEYENPKIGNGFLIMIVHSMFVGPRGMGCTKYLIFFSNGKHEAQSTGYSVGGEKN